MAAIITSNNLSTYAVEGFVDKRAEIVTLSTTDFVPGSSFLALDDGSVWILDSTRHWVELGGRE